MGKFSFEDKLKAVLDYLNGKESYRDIGKRIGIDHKSIVKWVSLYKVNGADGLKLKCTNYPAQFKIDVLNYMNEKGTSLLETASIFNIPAPATISQWQKVLEEQGLDALFSMRKGRPLVKKVRKEKQPVEGSQEALLEGIERLKQELEILKKAMTIFARK